MTPEQRHQFDTARLEARRHGKQARHHARLRAQQITQEIRAELDQLRQAEIDACHQCDDRGYLPTGRVCHHRPMSTTGAAAARAALTRQER